MADEIVTTEDKYELLGVDWKKKTLGVPTWGWGAILAGAFLLLRKRK